MANRNVSTNDKIAFPKTVVYRSAVPISVRESKSKCALYLNYT